jgi:hypothetical protein
VKDRNLLSNRLDEVATTYPDPLTIEKNKKALEEFDRCLSKSIQVNKDFKLMVEDTFSC